MGFLAPPEDAAEAAAVSGDRIAVEPCRSYGEVPGRFDYNMARLAELS